MKTAKICPTTKWLLSDNKFGLTMPMTNIQWVVLQTVRDKSACHSAAQT